MALPDQICVIRPSFSQIFRIALRCEWTLLPFRFGGMIWVLLALFQLDFLELAQFLRLLRSFAHLTSKPSGSIGLLKSVVLVLLDPWKE